MGSFHSFSVAETPLPSGGPLNSLRTLLNCSFPQAVIGGRLLLRVFREPGGPGVRSQYPEMSGGLDWAGAGCAKMEGSANKTATPRMKLFQLLRIRTPLIKFFYLGA